MAKQPKPPTQGPYQRVRAEIAGLLGVDLDKASFGQKLKLDHAVGLRLELDRMQAAQLKGEAVDLARFSNAAAELGKLLPPSDTSSWDLSKLTDDEVRIMERITAKAHGDDTVGDVSQVFRIEFVRPDDGKPDDDSEEVSSLQSRIAELDGYVAKLKEMNANQVQQITKLQREVEAVHTRPRFPLAEQRPFAEPPEPEEQIRAAPPAPSSNVRPLFLIDDDNLIESQKRAAQKPHWATELDFYQKHGTRTIDGGGNE